MTKQFNHIAFSENLDQNNTAHPNKGILIKSQEGLTHIAF